MATPEEIQLTYIRGVISECSPEEQAGIKAAKEELAAVIAKHEALLEGTGTMAFVLIGAELTAKP